MMEIEEEQKAKESDLLPKQKILVGASVSYSGPIPPAFELEKYEAIKPGTADRIISMAENQLAHKHSEEKKIVDSQIKNLEKINNRKDRGQFFAFILSIVAMGMGFYSSTRGYQIFGGFITSLGLGAIILAFIFGHKNKS